MFYSNGLPLAVSEFQVKHIIVKEDSKELVKSNEVYENRMIEKFYVDSMLYYYSEPIHRLNRYRINENDLDEYKGGLKDNLMRELLNDQVKPPIHECYALLALYKGKEKLKRFLFSW